ncbi:hypothetical protein B0T17DRAFT_538321 [Bombardia bombarda]|uniref:Uncharacterized protein n=1 Tax=Bombardia bombarda TaxID=252184 RepID=A0AA39WNN6_9PEZI|nr:hypothetical protein B0T17DRAFT_538321 [Bombardia bombarda]
MTLTLQSATLYLSRFDFLYLAGTLFTVDLIVEHSGAISFLDVANHLLLGLFPHFFQVCLFIYFRMYGTHPNRESLSHI